MKKIIILGIGLLIAVGLIFGVPYIYQTMQYKRIVSEIIIGDSNLSTIDDGTYLGSFDAIFVAAEVEVNIKDHCITGITLIEHKNERGAPAEVITDRVIESQSLQVDAISGATNSSKVILKAIENALASAPHTQ